MDNQHGYSNRFWLRIHKWPAINVMKFTTTNGNDQLRLHEWVTFKRRRKLTLCGVAKQCFLESVNLIENDLDWKHFPEKPSIY